MARPKNYAAPFPSLDSGWCLLHGSAEDSKHLPFTRRSVLASRRSIQVLLAFAITMTLGCGPSEKEGVVVKGKVLLDGQVMQVENAPPGVESGAEVHLYQGEENPLFSGTTLADGAFEFTDPKVDPGKYKLVVYFRNYGFDSDGLNGAFGESNSPIPVDIPEDKRGDTLDLGTIELNDYIKK